MDTIRVDRPPSATALLLAALRPKPRRATPIAALPALCYARPRVRLDAAHLARYAQVCGYAAAQGLPIVYPQLLCFPLLMAFFASPDCPWPALGTVHLANRIVQRRALAAGDALRVELRSGSLFAHDKGQLFTLEMKILRDDELVWEASQTLLRLGVQHPVGPAYASDLPAPPPLSHQADFSADGGVGRRYGRVSGDLNPIHLSALSARLFGFKRAIAHGMWTQARALAALLPRQPVQRATVAVEFKTPLYLPARVSLWTARELEKTGPAPAGGASLRGASFEVRNLRGDRPHLRGRLDIEPPTSSDSCDRSQR